jgi:hypothetical protein
MILVGFLMLQIILIIRGCAFTSPIIRGCDPIRITPRHYWPIGFKGGKGGRSWSGSGYTKIHSTLKAFAAIKDGSITAWGDASLGGTGAPSDSDYTKIYSTRAAFAAVKADGSITAWGSWSEGGTGAPSGNGYTKIYSNWNTLELNESWYSHYPRAHLCLQHQGTGAPSGNGYTKIYSNQYAFAALRADGSITMWGDLNDTNTPMPTDKGYTKIYSTVNSFAALTPDGSIKAWGDSGFGGANAPAGSGYTKQWAWVCLCRLSHPTL